MYSFKMSFWIVPASCFRGTPSCSATAMYIHKRIDAVALIVMEVLTRSRGSPCSSPSMSASESMATPTFPTSPATMG